MPSIGPRLIEIELSRRQIQGIFRSLTKASSGGISGNYMNLQDQLSEHFSNSSRNKRTMATMTQIEAYGRLGYIVCHNALSSSDVNEASHFTIQ